MQSVIEDKLQTTLLFVAVTSPCALSVGDFCDILYPGASYYVDSIDKLVAARRALDSLCSAGFLYSPASDQYKNTQRGKSFLWANRAKIASQGLVGSQGLMERVNSLKNTGNTNQNGKENDYERTPLKQVSPSSAVAESEDRGDYESLKNEFSASRTGHELYKGCNLVPYMEKADRGKLSAEEIWDMIEAYHRYDDWFHQDYVPTLEENARQSGDAGTKVPSQGRSSVCRDHRIYMEDWWKDITAILRARLRFGEGRVVGKMSGVETGFSSEGDSTSKLLPKFLVPELLDMLLKMTPTEFEHLTLRLFEKMGYGRGKVTGGSGDGGVDVIIKRDPLGLEQVHIQAKRWQKEVGEPAIRDFWTSLQAKGASKGIFATTSWFSKPAIETAKGISSSGGQTIILVNGVRLAELLIEYEVHVTVGS